MKFFKIIYIFIFLFCENVAAQGSEKNGSESEKMNFTSDNLIVNEKTNIMTATGNVVIIGNDRKITANKIEYDQNSDKAVATGNVVLTETDGSKYFSEKVILTNEFKSIVAIPFYGKLSDQSYITAQKLIKNDLGESFFHQGVYSACECNVKDGETPIWSISSKKVRHDPITKTIYLSDSVMKIFSMPIYYLPYLSFPDWTVKRKSGFLTPTFGYSKRNRFNIKVPYYYAPENDPTWDMTFTTHQNGKNGHADQLNIRKEYENSSVKTNIFKGNLNTNNSDGDDVFGMNVYATSNLKNNWNMILQGKYADQNTFMRRYGFDKDSIYKSFIELEKIRPNSISDIEIYNIKNLNETNTNNEPVLAPSISHHIFNNKKNYNYDIKLKAHSIYNDENYDIKRWSGLGQFNKKLNLNGLVLEGDGSLALDLYSVQGRPSSDTNNNKYIDRISTGFSIAASKQYDLINKDFGVTIEPKIQFSSMFSPDRTEEVPNRDSTEYIPDQANLFMNNQHQGRDNVQRNDRVNTGITSLIMTENYGDLNFFIGQSQKISGTQKNVFNKIQNRQSHVINTIDWNFNKKFNISWYSLYDHHDLETDNSDLNFNGSLDNWGYSITHRSIDKGFVSNNTDREELKLAISQNFSNFDTSYSTTYDLNDNKEQKISETLGIAYTGEGYMLDNCLTILFEYKSSRGINDRDLLSEDSIYLTFAFRNLGDYKY